MAEEVDNAAINKAANEALAALRAWMEMVHKTIYKTGSGLPHGPN